MQTGRACSAGANRQVRCRAQGEQTLQTSELFSDIVQAAQPSPAWGYVKAHLPHGATSQETVPAQGTSSTKVPR